LLKEVASDIIVRAAKVHAEGAATNLPCGFDEELWELRGRIDRLKRIVALWASPRISVGPAPRVTLSEATVREIEESLKRR